LFQAVSRDKPSNKAVPKMPPAVLDEGFNGSMDGGGAVRAVGVVRLLPLQLQGS